MQGNQEKESRNYKKSRRGAERAPLGDKIKNLFGRDRTVTLAREILRGLFYAAVAFFFARCELLFSAAPLGFALLFASPGGLGYILAGCVAGAWSFGRLRWIYISAYVAGLLLRYFIKFIISDPYPEDKPEAEKPSRLSAVLGSFNRYAERVRRAVFGGNARTADGKLPYIFDLPKSFDDSIALRALLATLTAFFACLCRVILGGFAYYDVFGLLFSIVVAPAAVLIFSGVFDEKLRAGATVLIGEAGLLFALVYSLSGADLLGISLPLFTSWLLILLLCRHRGAIFGIFSALICGLAYSPAQIPLFLLPAILTLLLGSISMQLALCGAGVATLLWAVYSSGASSLIEIVPALMLAFVTYLLLCGELGSRAISPKERIAQGIARREAMQKEKKENMAALVATKSRMDATEEKLAQMSEAFGSLSELFFGLCDRLRRPAMLDLRRMCDSAFDKFCPSCPSHDVCWGMEYGITLEVLNRLTSRLHTKGEVDGTTVPEYLRTRCENMENIIAEINKNCASLTEAALKTEKTEVFALDYAAISKILTETVESSFESYSADLALSAKIYDYMVGSGYSLGGAVVIVGRQKQVILYGVGRGEKELDLELLRSTFSDMCACRLSLPVSTLRGSGESLTFSARPIFCVKSASVGHPAKDSEGRSGDSLSLFSARTDKFYSLISDGMGSGQSAALTSSICTVFLEKMLSAGNRVDTSLRMLNNFIRTKGTSAAFECSSTVDLAEIDLLCGEVAFVKSGAAPSFIVRNSNIYKIESRTAPIGIMNDIDTQITRFGIRDGDVIIMVSDGVIPDGNFEAFMTFLSENFERAADPQKLADMIVANARISGSTDDISATVVKILGNE